MATLTSPIALRRLLVFILCGPTLLMSRMAVAQRSDPQNRVESDARDAERERRQKEAEDARTRRLIEGFSDSVRQTSDLLGKLEGRASTLQKQMAELLQSNDGKRIAQDKLAFFAYLRVRDEPVVTPGQVAVRKKQVDQIHLGLQEELKRLNVGWLPDEMQRKDVDGLYFWATERLDRVEQQEFILGNAISRSPATIDIAKAKTLQSVLQEYEARQIENWLIVTEQGRESAQKEGQEKIRESARIAELEKATQEAERLLKEERAKLATLKAEHELALQKRETEDYKRRIETETKLRDLAAEVDRLKQLADAQRVAKDADVKVAATKTVSEAEKKLLAQKCNEPEVRQILAPFLAAGYTQPGSSDQLPDKLPISFSQLGSCGALTPDREGMRRLIIVATWKNDKVRPRWSVSQNFNWLSPDQIEMVKKAQKLLVELGPVMVEQGLLSP